jgi:hypothetical protein
MSRLFLIKATRHNARLAQIPRCLEVLGFAQDFGARRKRHATPQLAREDKQIFR